LADPLRLGPADRLVAFSVAAALGGVALAAATERPALVGATAIIVLALLLGGAWATGSSRLAWLHVMGAVAGVLELGVDWLHVEHLGTLVYTNHLGLRLLASPWYMPLGWWLTIVQFGWLGLRLAERLPRGSAIGLVALTGALIPPWYEELAAPAKAWHYTTSGPRLSNTPLWVPLAYVGCMASISAAAIVTWRDAAWGRAALAGVATALGIAFSGLAALAVLG
jgi:hypothetical protein